MQISNGILHDVHPLFTPDAEIAPCRAAHAPELSLFPGERRTCAPRARGVPRDSSRGYAHILGLPGPDPTRGERLAAEIFAD